MDNFEFSKHYVKYLERLQLEGGKHDAKKVADAHRKCTALTYNTSLKLLDNHSICHVLENNLNKYSAVVTTPIDNNIKKVLSERDIQTANLKSCLTKLDIKSLIKPLCLPDGGVACVKSEAVSDSEFKTFVKAFSQTNMASKVALTEQPISNASSSTSSSNDTAAAFRTANEEYRRQQQVNKNKGENGSSSRAHQPPLQYNSTGGTKKQLGMTRNVKSKFIPPIQSTKTDVPEPKPGEWGEQVVDQRLRSIEPKMVELIKSEIMDCSAPIDWNDIAGLEFAKSSIQEVVVWPMLRPDIFTGLRRPPKGILLFGPPGTGKTLIGKCVASQSKSTFFSISASSLTSKWMGDGEKMVRALFTVARCSQPSVIFIDEIDSLLTQRSDTEHESTRRIKTEFLIQLDGANTDVNERLLVIGATNRPQELDEAARRRFVKRLYIPLPDYKARFQLVTKLISNEKHELSVLDFEEIAKLSEGYSGADIRHLCSEASLGPIRSMDMTKIEKIKANEVRPLLMEDFTKAFSRVRSSVSTNDLHQYESWDKTFGSGL